MIIVLDTNVFVSGLRGQERAPGQIFSAWQLKEISLAYSPQMLEELKRVFTYSKVRVMLGRAINHVDQALDDLTRMGILTAGTEKVTVIANDLSDNMFLACAKEANAQLLVSGDYKHILPLKQFGNTMIVTPQECVTFLKAMKKKAA